MIHVVFENYLGETEEMILTEEELIIYEWEHSDDFIVYQDIIC